MAQRRKVEVTVVDDSDGGLHSLFRSTANDLSQLYSQAINQQKLAFDAGQTHALEKFNEWVASKLQEGKIVTVAEICAYLQNELNNSVPSSQLPELWGSGSHHNGASQDGQMELGLSSSAAFLPSQEIGTNVFGSQDLEMEITPEDPIPIPE